MARKLIVAAAVALAGVALIGPAGAWAADWIQPVNAPLNANPASSAENPDITSIGGVPWVAWHESNGSSNLVRVAMLSNGGWQPVGQPIDTNSTFPVRSPTIASVGGVPYIAWLQVDAGIFNVHVARFQGGSWVPVGGSLNVNPGRQAESPAITDIGGVPYVTWDEYNGTSQQVRVASFNGATWSPVGASLNFNPSGNAFNPAITSIGGAPFVVWQENDGSVSQIRAAGFNGSAWSPVGGVLNVDPNVDAEIPSIADVGGVPYVAWDEHNGQPHLVHVAKLNGGAWQVVGAPLNVNPTQGAFTASIADIGGTPYVAWRENSNSPQVHVARLTGSSWSLVDGILNVDQLQDARTPSIASIGDVPYVAWQETNGAPFQVRVKRLTPNNSFTYELRKKQRKLLVHIVDPGKVDVVGTGGAKGAAVTAKKRKAGKSLKPSSTSGGPGTIVVKLKLTKRGRKTLGRRGKIKLGSTITFTPTGGMANSQPATLKLKPKRKKHRHRH